MKVAVIGSRDLYINIGKYIEKYIGAENITMIISGGARGIDTLAEEYAYENNIPTKIFYPDYDKDGATAPIRRNAEIVDAADIVVAFWDKQSRGTGFVIDYAKKTGKKLIEVRVNVNYEQI